MILQRAGEKLKADVVLSLSQTVDSTDVVTGYPRLAVRFPGSSTQK